MPHRLSDQELEAGFIVRNEVFEQIVGKLKSETAITIPQHYLIVGQRGMGKTTLLLRIALELRNNKEHKRLIPLSFPEEQYNIDRLSKFWLNCLDALADILETENNKPLVDEIDEVVKKISREVDEKELAEKAFEAFQLMAQKTKRRPVLLIDNLNQLLDSLQQNEQWELRNRITKAGSPILLGASAEPLKENYTYDAPFYDSFEVFLLEKLRFEETIFLLQSLAARTGQTELVNRLNSETARIRTLYTLTGGNPRTVVILFQVFAKGFSATVYEDLDTLLEAVTPIYKARFEELSPQLQVVVDAVALRWDPCRLEDLRELTRLANPQLSSQLKRLREIGWISQMEAFGGRGAAYEISERFFNVWYLMRRSSRRQRRELLCLTKFLESLYAEDIDKVAECYLNDPVKDIHHVTYGLALANAAKGLSLGAQIRNKAFDNLIEQEISADMISIFEMPEEYKNEKEKEFNVQVKELLNSKGAAKALDVLQKWKKVNASNVSVWTYEGVINAVYLKKFTEAEAAYRKAIELDEKNAIAWYNWGVVLGEGFKKYEEAENAYRKALECDTLYVSAWNGLGNLLQDHLRRYSEAETAYRNAILIDEGYPFGWIGLGNLLQNHLKRYEESKSAYQRAIELDIANANAWIGLGNLFHNHLKRYDEAENAYKKAIELDPKNVPLWNSFGALLQAPLKKYSEAEIAFRKAIELDDKYALAWNNLGALFQDYLGNYEEAEAAYLTAIKLESNNSLQWINLGNLWKDRLKKYKESEIAFRNAIQSDENAAEAWNGLGNLLHYHLNNYQESEVAYRRAIQIDEKNAFYWYDLANLFHYGLKKFEDAIDSYNQAIRLNNKHAEFWAHLGDLLHYKLEKYIEAEAAYRKSLELDSKDFNSWLDLASLLHFHLNTYEEAEIAYRMAIQLDGTQTIAWLGLSNLFHYCLGKHSDAEVAYRKAISIDDKLVNGWLGLSHLLHFHLKRYEEAKVTYTNVIELDRVNTYAWNGLGNLLQDHLGEYLYAKECYENAIKSTSEFLCPMYNLIFLLRDKLNDLGSAKKILSEIRYRDTNKLEDCRFLNEALFSFYDKNVGIGINYWKQALGLIGDSLPPDTHDDWQRAAAITVKLGYGETLIQVLKETGHDIILRPFYEAISAFTMGTENYLNSVAAEVREPARQIYQYMKEYAEK